MKFNKWTLGLAAVAVMAFTSTINAQTFSDSVKDMWKATLGSTNAQYDAFAERKLTGDAWKAGVVGLYNATENLGVGIGVAHEWTPNGKIAAASYQLSVGVQLKMAFHPLANFGFTNFTANLWGGTFVGTPFSGQNGGSLLNANRTGIDITIWKFEFAKNPLTIDAGAYYGNETGTGYYAGNWAGAYIGGCWGAKIQPVVADNPEAVPWARKVEALRGL